MTTELLTRIAEAFRGVPRPTVITKSVARALDDEWNLSPESHAELRENDKEQSWVDIADNEIEKFDDILTFLDADGYLFYLPAFMSYSLRRYNDSDSVALDAPIFACANCAERLHLFSPTQMRCVIDFLTFAACEEGRFNTSWAAYAIDHLKLNAPEAEQVM
jgi:hypothetical protein